MDKTPKKQKRLLDRQRESEIPNRSKLNTRLKNVPAGQRKGFKNIYCRTKQQTPWTRNSSKKSTVQNKGTESVSKMKPESETAEVKADPPSETKTTAKPESSKETRASTEKHVDRTASESARATSKEEEQQNGESEKDQTETRKAEEKANKSVKTKPTEEHEEVDDVDLTLSLDNDENSPKPRDEKIEEEPTNKENEKDRIELESVAQQENVEVRNDTENVEVRNETENVEVRNETENVEVRNETEDVEVRNDTETSVAVVSGGVPSSNSAEPSSESASQDDERKEKEKEKERKEQTATERKEQTATEQDYCFIVYDSSITLKDVQIKLNDCMKESSKPAEASNANQQAAQDENQESSIMERLANDLSFGTTLKNISGRRSLGRMWHGTKGDHRYSPNNSMFVNTSGASLLAEENEDFKILRYNTGLSETISAINGSSLEKKRKYEVNEDRAGKKQKTDTDKSLLNTSLGLPKGLRRPIQASTPVAELKFQSSKLDLFDDERKSVDDHQDKKWCAVM